MKGLEEGKTSEVEYLVAKTGSNHARYDVKKVAEEKKFGCMKEHDNGIFKIFKQMKIGSQDIVGKKCVLDGNEDFCFNSAAKSSVRKNILEVF